jgi:hypothetical protein
VWRNPELPAPLREAADRAGAVLLYVEGGAVATGARVRGVGGEPAWAIDLADAWLVPAGAPP